MRGKKKGLSSKIHGKALTPYGPKYQENPKFGRKEAGLNRKGRKNRKIGKGRM